MKYLFSLLFIFFMLNSQAKTYRIGVQDISYYPLYDFPNPSHTKELLDTFARLKGYTFEYVNLPIKRINYWYQDNNIDFKYPDNIRWTKGKKINELLSFSEPVIELIASAMVNQSNKGTPRSEIRRIGTLLGFHPTMWLDLIKEGKVEVIESPSTLNIVKQTLLGSVDVNNIEPSVVNHHLKLLGKENQLVIDMSLPYETYYFHLSTIKHKEVLLEFNQFLQENKTLLKMLNQKYEILDPSPYRKSN